MMDNTRYFATVTAGLERIAWCDCARVLPGARLLSLGHRSFLFVYDGPQHLLLSLRAVDDLFVYVGELADVGATRVALSGISKQASMFDLEQAAATCREVRTIPDRPRYAITASFVGARTYSRYEIAAAVAAGIGERYDWPYVENTPDSHDVRDLDLRVAVEGDRGLVGLRLAVQPLHRRTYKVSSRPGSLKAPVAYALALLADIAPGERLIDPCCGVGTIALEAAQLTHPAPVLASDLSTDAVADAQKNAAGSLFDVLLFAADAGTLPLSDSTVDAVVSNLPFGRQVAISGDLETSYTNILVEIARIVRPRGRAVLLTDQGAAFTAALRTTPALRLAAAHQISLFGLHPIIYVITKRAA